MAYAIGIVLALVVGVFGRFAGFDLDRAFYSSIAVVVASYYVLFAAIGFRFNLWLVGVGLAAHGVLDVSHDFVVSNSGVPQWWPRSARR